MCQSEEGKSRARETKISEEDGGCGAIRKGSRERSWMETYLINNNIQASWRGAGRQPD